jgi:hypothetical protein
MMRKSTERTFTLPLLTFSAVLLISCLSKKHTRKSFIIVPLIFNYVLQSPLSPFLQWLYMSMHYSASNQLRKIHVSGDFTLFPALFFFHTLSEAGPLQKSPSPFQM